MNRIARLLLATVAVPVVGILPALNASAQLVPEPPIGAVAQLLELPVLDFTAGPAEIAAQLAAERVRLADAQQALATLGDVPEAAALRAQIAEIETRIGLLELFAEALPELALDAPIEGLRQQLAALQTERSTLEAALPGAREAGQTAAAAAIESRLAQVNDRVAQLEGAIAAREAAPPVAPEPAAAPPPAAEPVPPPAAPEPAPAPQPEPAPAPQPEPAPAPQPAPAPVPEPVPAPAPQPEPAPAPQPAPVPPAPAPQPPAAEQPAAAPAVAQLPAPTAEQAALDATIAAFLQRPLPSFDLTADVASLRQQLSAHEGLRTEGEALLGGGRAAERDVTALAERLAEVQQRITQLTDEIARREGAAAAAPPPPDVVEQLAAGGDAAAAANVLTLRDQLLQDLLRIGAGLVMGPQQPAAQPPAGQPQPPLQPAPVVPPPAQFGTIVGTQGERMVFLQGDQYQVRRTETEELDRLLYQAEAVDVEDLGNGFTRTTVYRTDGTRVVTLTDAYGRILERIRIEADGRETILIAYAGPPPGATPAPPPTPIIFEETLPPFVLTIPVQDYIIEADRVTWQEIAAALTAPPVDVVERPYTLEEIRFSHRLREKVRRIDLTTITFDFGSAAINPDQFDELAEIGRAIEAVLAAAPNTILYIEGHADAVGSDYANLLLSDRRAETIAVALSTNFNIPSENLITQGYGEQFLKVQTLGPERQNRRGVISNITPLLFGAAAG